MSWEAQHAGLRRERSVRVTRIRNICKVPARRHPEASPNDTGREAGRAPP